MTPSGTANWARRKASGSASSAATAASRDVIGSTTADLPKVGEGGLEQRRAQVRGAGRTAGAHARADDPLHHLDVPVTPFLDALVDVEERLADLGGRARVVGVHLGQD